MENPTTCFSPRQVRDFVKSVRKECGDGWAWLIPRVREALIAEKALLVLGAQEAKTIATDECHALLHAMLVEAGLREAQS